LLEHPAKHGWRCEDWRDSLVNPWCQIQRGLIPHSHTPSTCDPHYWKSRLFSVINECILTEIRASRAYNCWCRTMPKCNLERVCDQTRIIIPHVTVSLPGFYYGHPAIEPKVPGISLHVVLNSGTMHTIKFHICQLCSFL
jgi:hypothetical protein